MFPIFLYRFNKKPNSTKVPGTGEQDFAFTCEALDETSIINPSVRLRASLSDISTCNYAYINIWHRYYFIEDIICEYGGNVVLNLKVDVLGSYREQIRASTQYVLRSSSRYDGSIIDSYYPTQIETDFDNAFPSISYGGNSFDCMDMVSDTYISGYFSRTIAQGEFVIGVIGDNETGISYYVLNYTNFKNLMTNLLNYTPSNMNDVSTGIAKVLADPMQYITTCFWIPWAGQVSQTTRSIKFGYYSVSCNAGILNASDHCHFQTFITLPKHPQASSRGEYLNVSPYTSLTFFFNPFGELQLDTVTLASAQKLRIEWYYDCTKGNGELFIYNNDTGEISYHGYCDMLGVPIQMTQLTVNSIKTGASVLDAIGHALTGNISAIFGSIGNAVESQQPKVSKSGSEGSFLNYHIRPMLRAEFNLVVDEDLDHAGRPLCQLWQLSSVSGYAQIGNASISIPFATANELRAIEAYMTDGFYIE